VIVGAFRRDEGHVRHLVAGPGELALHVAAGIGLALDDCGRERDLAAQMREQRGHAMGAHHRQGGIEPALPEHRHLVERALPNHRLETAVDPGAQRVAIRRKKDLRQPGTRERPGDAVGLEGGQRQACRSPEFERAQHAQAVARTQARRAGGITPGQIGVEALGLPSLGRRPNGRAHRVGNCRHVGQTLAQGLQIKAGAARHDRNATLELLRQQRGRDIGKVASDRIILRAVDVTVKPVRRLGRLGIARARGEDTQVAIDLHRIRVDHGPAERPREPERQRRLARRRRPCDEDRVHLTHMSAGSLLPPADPAHESSALADTPSAPTAHVATLVCDPRRPALSDAVLAKAVAVLGAARIHPLRHGIAADLLFESSNTREPEAALRDALADLAIDVVVQPNRRRRKRLFLADMDSTMIAQECIDELADFVGLKAEVSAITERAMRGEIAFEPALRERVALLKGLAIDVVDRIIAERITEMPGGRSLVHTMRAHGAYTCLVSGGFTVFTGPIGAKLGFDENRANRLLLDGAILAGTVAEPILGREAKLATLAELRGRFRLGADETLAVGDGANDLAMLGEAGLGVAFHAKPAVAAATHARIDHADLTALLYIQGFSAAEFVEG
jgi:phosphoserine phosphatase